MYTEYTLTRAADSWAAGSAYLRASVSGALFIILSSNSLPMLRERLGIELLIPAWPTIIHSNLLIDGLP